MPEGEKPEAEEREAAERYVGEYFKENPHSSLLPRDCYRECVAFALRHDRRGRERDELSALLEELAEENEGKAVMWHCHKGEIIHTPFSIMKQDKEPGVWHNTPLEAAQRAREES